MSGRGLRVALQGLLRSVLFFWVIGIASGSASAQVCQDADADDAPAGFDCATATDCADRSWSINPDAVEICDGLDQDCSASPDEGCDRFCDTPFLRRDPVLLEFPLLSLSSGNVMGLSEHGLLVASIRDDPSNDAIPLYARAFDRRGRARDSERWVSEQDSPLIRELQPAIAVSGDRAFVTWQDQRTWPDDEGYIQRGRVLDANARPVAPDVDFSAPVGSPPRYDNASTLWDGERFVAFWFARSEPARMYMSIVDADGVPAEPATRLVTDDADGRGYTIQRSEALWTGEKYLVVMQSDIPPGVEAGRIVVRQVSYDGTPGGTTILPIRARLEDAVITNDRVVLLLTWRNGLTDDDAWLAFLDFNGNLVDPGIPWIGSFSGDGIERSRLAWTGEMFGVAVTDIVSGPTYFYKWWFVRVSSDGVALDEPILIIDNETVGKVTDLLWNGRDFWLLGTRNFGNGWQTYLHTITCSCFDDDGDTFDACFGEDCDDTDPTAYPGGTELCRGDRDEDCDGLIDCDDYIDCPAGIGPAGIDDLIWNEAGLAWSAPASAQSYDLARGLWSDVQRRGDYLMAECIGPELDQPQWTDDGRRPVPGDMLWYLIRTESNPCSRSDWGPTNRDRTIEICR